MKKHLSIVVVVIALLAIFASSVSAAAGGTSVSLVGVQYTKGGIVLIFNTSGLRNADLKNASFFADSHDQNISCNFMEDSAKVRCVVAKSLAGKGSFRVSLAGFGFQGQLPQEKSSEEPTTVCGAGEELTITLTQYRSGQFWWSQPVPVSKWAAYQATPRYQQELQDGYTYQVSGAFCVAVQTQN